jgi:hypothetical protein
MVPFPVPPAVTVHQDALLAEVHAELEVTVKVVVPAGAVTFLFDGATESVGATPAAVNVPAIPGACGVHT